MSSCTCWKEDKSGLHSDPEVSNGWTNDPQTWRDVYSIKPQEYLQLVASGENPVWDKDSKKFISSMGGEETFGGSALKPKVEVEDAQSTTKVDDNLPF